MTRRTDDRYISATQLASLGHCEVKLVLDRRYGESVTPAQAEARRRGNVEHERFHRAATVAHNQPPPELQPAGRGRATPCFIATAVYGEDDPRTDQLRTFRNQRLMPTRWGRALVLCYYTLSPPLARFLTSHRIASRLVACLLDAVRLCITSHQEPTGCQPTPSTRCPARTPTPR